MNNSEIFIHIGYHKTGTTFLQKLVFPLLKANLVMIPDVTYIAQSKNYDPKHFIEMLNNQYVVDKYDKTIMSQETLSGRGDGNPVWDKYLIAKRLHATFPGGKILIVIRNQFDYILSLYTFRVIKRGIEKRNLSDYLEDIFEKRLLNKLRYDELIKYYINLFGKESVLVLTYEQLVKDHNKFISKISQFINVENMVDCKNRKINKGTRNQRLVQTNRLLNHPVSITADFLRNKNILSQKKYFFFVNKYFKFKEIILNPVSKRLYGGSKNIELDNKWRKMIITAFKESNHNLADIIDINLSCYGYPW